ncbi:hypothetical protein CDA63_11920 [Hymenobacter amundsenii]|uniref:Uncharacterized protein n=1 Tax=Hymenobacter amundsenii TaxID=2006685 RepID=A0A246FK51_9BACT|nr:hypothetical protein [Hymenobacter amundsenii]OWP62919.1 hypothetical protein CDA63_11920 [Hymenobacter amundsenii]
MSKKTILIISFFALLIYGAVTSKSSPPEKDYVDIHPGIKAITAGLVVSNTDTFSYYRPEITINKDYKYIAPSVGKNGNIVVRWDDFVDSDGKRFSAVSSKVAHLKIVTAAPNKKLGIFITQEVGR